MAEGSSDSLVKDAIVSVLYDTSGPQVNVKGISQDLVHENVIDGNLEECILSQQTDSECQHILAQHLHNHGTLESAKRLCRVLQRTANRYHSHASTAENLEKACGFSSLAAHSHEKCISHTPGELHNSEMSEEEIIDVFRRGSLQLKKYYEKLPPVPFKPYRPTLDYIELAVINRGEEKIKNEAQVKKFLRATMQGIDAIHKRLRSIKYVEILKFDKECPTTGRRIIISGAPGCGKSTLSRQLCKDLSSGTLRNTYQLVILVELRELVYRMKEGEQLGLKHLLMKYPYLSTAKFFDAFHCGYGKNVLFILDGYDELDESLRSCQFLQDILSTCTPSLFLSECDVVITTRPVTSGELFELVESPSRNVEILGFTEEHIHVYIDKYFENLENGQVKADKLKGKLKQLPHVRGMCRVPIVLEFVCKVHHILGDQGIPDTQTGIYGTYIVAELFNCKPKLSNSKPHSQVCVQDLLIVSEEDFPGFYELCHKAFQCCSSTKGQRLLLTEQDVSNLTQYLNRGSIYGLLFADVVQSVCGSVNLFHYLHKSIQEMLAAVHIARLPDEKHAPLWKDQFGRPEMAEIWKYYAGITELKKLDTNTLFDIFKETKKDQKVLLMLSLYEANNKEVAEKVLPVMFSENKISITLRSSYEIVAVNYCIKHHPSLTSFKLKLIGQKPAIKFGEPLKYTACQISSHPTLKRFTCSGFKKEDWTLFTDGLVPFKSVSTFDIDEPPSTILSSIAKNSFDLPDLTLKCSFATQGNTPVDEKGLCEAWSQCKCKTVKMEILYYLKQTPQGISLLTGILRGIAQNKTSVEFKLGFYPSDDRSYYMERIPEDILTHFTRDGETLTLNPLNSRCPTSGVSSGESPQTPGSNPTGEPSNKRCHIEQPPLVGVTDCSSSVIESTSSSPAQQVDHASRNVHSTQSDSSRSSPKSQRASLPQTPPIYVGVIVDPSSLATVSMETSRSDMSLSNTHSHISAHHTGDSPQPPSTYLTTHPIDPKYKTGRSTYLSSSATSQDILPLMDTSPMTFPALHPPCDVQTLTGPLQRASSQYLSSSGPSQQSNSLPVPHVVAQQMPRTPYSQHMYSHRGLCVPGPRHYNSQGTGMLQQVRNPQSVRHFQPSFHYSQSRPNLHRVEAPFSPSQVPGPHRPGMSQHIPFPTPQYRPTALQPVQYPQPPSHPNQSRLGYHSDSSSENPVYTPPPPQGPLPTEDLPGPSSLSYPPQYCEPHPPYPSTHYSHPPTLSGGSGFDCRQFMEKYKDRFLQCVDSRAISIRLLMEGIIPPYLSHQLQNVDSTTGTQLLFLHLQEQANRNSLLQLCNVMINMAGYHNMSSLGGDMKRDLEQPVNSSTS